MAGIPDIKHDDLKLALERIPAAIKAHIGQDIEEQTTDELWATVLPLFPAEGPQFTNLLKFTTGDEKMPACSC